MKMFLVLLVLIISHIARAAEPIVLSFEQRLLSAYAIEAYGLKGVERAQFVDKMHSHLMAIASLPVKEVEVANFEQFLNEFKGEWPQKNLLSEDLKYLQNHIKPIKEIKSKNERVQKKIDLYLENQKAQIEKMNEQKGILQESEVESVLGKGQIEALLSNPLILQSEEAQKELLNQTLVESEALIEKIFAEYHEIGQKFTESGFGAQQDPMIRIFLKTLLSEYFGRVSMSTKKQIVNSILQLPLDASDLKKFEVMIQNAGPQFQKLLQVIARQPNIPTELLEVFKALESSVKPVPWSDIETMLEKESKQFQFTYFEKKALGVGTMAQVHRAKILVNGKNQSVVVRFLKPGIELRVREDHRILMEVAKILDANPEFMKSGAPKLGPVIPDLTQTVQEELSQKETMIRQNQGAEAYNRDITLSAGKYKNTLEVRVPRIYNNLDVDSDFMIQEMVFGRKLDKEIVQYEGIVPDLKKAVVEEIARLWMDELMFKSGFYHSDLHQGNFMLLVQDDKIRLNILDFGMGGVISEEMQKNIILLGVGIELQKPELIARAFWRISEEPKNTIGRWNFERRISAQVELLRKSSTEWTTQQWIVFALDNGLKLPYEFVSINRGKMIVDKLLENAKSELTTDLIAQKMAVNHPRKLYKYLVQEGHITWVEFVKLGYARLMSSEVTTTPPKVETKTPVGLRCEAVFL